MLCRFFSDSIFLKNRRTSSKYPKNCWYRALPPRWCCRCSLTPLQNLRNMLSLSVDVWLSVSIHVTIKLWHARAVLDLIEPHGVCRWTAMLTTTCIEPSSIECLLLKMVSIFSPMSFFFFQHILLEYCGNDRLPSAYLKTWRASKIFGWWCSLWNRKCKLLHSCMVQCRKKK